MYYTLTHHLTWQELLGGVAILGVAALVGLAQGLIENYRESHPKR